MRSFVSVCRSETAFSSTCSIANCISSTQWCSTSARLCGSSSSILTSMGFHTWCKNYWMPGLVSKSRSSGSFLDMPPIKKILYAKVPASNWTRGTAYFSVSRAWRREWAVGVLFVYDFEQCVPLIPNTVLCFFFFSMIYDSHSAKILWMAISKYSLNKYHRKFHFPTLRFIPSVFCQKSQQNCDSRLSQVEFWPQPEIQRNAGIFAGPRVGKKYSSWLCRVFRNRKNSSINLRVL